MTNGAATLKVLDLQSLLEIAEYQLLVERKVEFVFPIRRKAGVENFYELLESELQTQDLLTVAAYRSVKEGWAKISRPSHLVLTRENLLLHRPHLRVLEKEVQKWRSEFVELGIELLLVRLFKELIVDVSVTTACLEVFNYLIHHRSEIRGLLPRQLQHANSTKLIGRENLLLRMFGVWRGESANWHMFHRYFELVETAVEFRFFAPKCVCQRAPLNAFHGVLSSEWIADYDFSPLAGTLVVENLQTFYAESAQSKDRLILWGAGWKAALLREFHRSLPRPILYWGDIDKEGYEIYGYLKSHIPDLCATLMDHQTVGRHRHLAIRREAFFGPYKSAADLQAEYQAVSQQGLCIEQEKIHDRPY